MPIVSQLTGDVRLVRPVRIVQLRTRRAEARRSNPAERGIARTLSSRMKRLVLSGALILATLAGISVAAAPAYAGGPPPVSFIQQWGHPPPIGGGAVPPPPDQFENPFGVAADGSGSHIYVADNLDQRVQEFAYGGKFLQTPSSTVPGYFAYPSGVAVDSAGEVYVSQDGADSIDVFNSSGAYLRSWGGPGSAPGEFNNPAGVAVDGAGDVYVADCGNNRVQKFTSGGAFLQGWGGSPGQPTQPGTGLGQFNCPANVAVDGAGNVYVTDYNNDRVQKLTTGGTWVSWGSPGSAHGYFNHPQGIAVDRFGNVFVADTGNNRVQQFDSSGTFLQSWGGGPNGQTGQGQFWLPVGVAVVSTPPWDAVARGTTIYVTQAGSDRVEQFWEGTSLVHQCAVCVTVPNLYGTFEREARSELASLGLNVSEYVSVNTQVGCNDVFSQSPAAGTSVLAGSTVTLGLADNPNDPGGCF